MALSRLVVAIFLLLAGPVQAAKLTGMAIVPGTVTIASDAPVAVGHHFSLHGPSRLVVDLPAVVDAPITLAGAGSVTQLRLAMFSPGVARLVLDLKVPLVLVSAHSGAAGLELKLRRATEAEFVAAVMAGRKPLGITRAETDFELPAGLFPDRGAPAVPAPPARMTPAGPELPAATTPVQPRPAVAEPLPEVAPQLPTRSRLRARGVKPRSGSKPLVVIDAGHGGKDVGAISVRGGYEKEVTLAIARATARRLERSGRVRVRLTRDDDRFIPLGGRVNIARAARADLFISVHADAAGNAEARGASVYTISTVASDEVAERLAARENKADIIGGVNLGIEAPDVGDIMIELSRRATTNVSVAFAEVLQEELESRMRFRGEFHHFAGFRVLKAPDVPSVLLETGYVTNGEDSDFLFSGEGQSRVADGIARAVERHLLGD